MSIDIGEMGSDIAGLLLIKGTPTASMVDSLGLINTFFDMCSKRDHDALKEAIRNGFRLQLKSFSEDKTAQFDFNKIIKSGIIPRVNQLFLSKFHIELDLPNYDLSEMGSEVAGLICIQGTRTSGMVGSAVLIDALFERYKGKNVDATALKEAIEDQFEKTFREFQDEGGFNIEKLEKSGIIASTGRSFRSHFRTELNITIPAGLGSRMTDSMHKLLRKLDNLP